jgi:hypothetical protein
MTAVIVNQLKLRDVPISAYAEISSQKAWFWMALIIAVMNIGVLMQGEAFIYLGSIMIMLVGIYIGCRIVGWWLASRGYYDGSGNLWGLFVTASTIDMASPLFAMIHPGVSILGMLYSLAIFANALKSGLGLSDRATLVALVLPILSALAVIFVAGVLFGFIAAAAGLPMPEM